MHVTLNAITVDGVVQRGLSAANFEVIENGCALPTTSVRFEKATGNIGVDIVLRRTCLARSNAIAGVRSSVITFAQNLTAGGLNVRLGSVGYSGPGTIPSSPASSAAEFLGPVQQPTTADLFQNHVQTQWFAFVGADDPENGLEAIEYAMFSIAWRSGSARVLIAITDVSHHTNTTNCNGSGPCTDRSLASILALLSGRATVHVVAHSSAARRTAAGGLDPWLIADGNGGQRLTLLSNGVVNLDALGISDVIGETVRLSFVSASRLPAPQYLMIRVMIGGKVAELAPGLVTHAPLDHSLQAIP